MDALARINDAVYSWNSIVFRMGTFRTTGLVSIDFDDKITSQLQYTARRDGTPIGETAGKYEPGDSVLKFLLEAWTGGTTRFPLGIEPFVLHDGVGSSGRTRIPIFLQWFEEATGQPVSVLLESARCIGRKIGSVEGVEGTVIETTFRPLNVRINGISLASSLRSVP